MLNLQPYQVFQTVFKVCKKLQGSCGRLLAHTLHRIDLCDKAACVFQTINNNLIILNLFYRVIHAWLFRVIHAFINST